ncbi:MAG: hypothetical protein HY241_15125 [Actinobacteria bacterium]|nr:hypothetical protein [Actinomycetota bacterium]
MTPQRVDLVESGPDVAVTLAAEVGVALAGTGFVDARPVPGTPLWSLRPLSKVGAVSVRTSAGGGVEVHVAPKIPIARIMVLLEHSPAGVRWQTPTVDVGRHGELLGAVVEVFERLATRALAGGLQHGYRTVEEALPVVRGRVREAEQLRRRFVLPLPVEVRYDDFTVDTAENRLLRSAVTRARRLVPALRLAQVIVDGS